MLDINQNILKNDMINRFARIFFHLETKLSILPIFFRLETCASLQNKYLNIK